MTCKIIDILQEILIHTTDPAVTYGKVVSTIGNHPVHIITRLLNVV